MSGSVETEIDKTSATSPETRAAAARYIVRTQDDAGELLLILGLAVEVKPDTGPVRVDSAGRRRCTACGRPVKPDAECRARGCGGAS